MGHQFKAFMVVIPLCVRQDQIVTKCDKISASKKQRKKKRLDKLNFSSKNALSCVLCCHGIHLA